MKHIRIIGPAGIVTDRNPETVLQQIVDFLESHRFKVSVQKDIFASPLLPYHANTKEKRMNGFLEALSDIEVDIILPFRGGSGSAPLAIAAMDKAPSSNKILLGFSDITSLHLLFNQHYKLSSIHCPVGTSLMRMPNTIHQIIEVLSGKKQTLPLKAINNLAQESAEISGELVGGNLTIFATMIGTKLSPETKGKILLFEDIREDGYKIDRTLTHLELAGLLDDIKACVLADFTESDKDLDFAINSFAARSNFPVFRAEGIGHGEVNIPVVLGNIVSIKNHSLEYSLK
ncbi:MAG: hypothetical protein RLZZ59_123 [Pseudomonadota bacterium]|jgi:muramoyltetrapeptide carboxypeptidase LdcA involved in peptidoglycan recycling